MEECNKTSLCSSKNSKFLRLNSKLIKQILLKWHEQSPTKKYTKNVFLKIPYKTYNLILFFIILTMVNKFESALFCRKQVHS